MAVEELRDAVHLLEEGQVKEIAEQRLEIREKELAADDVDGDGVPDSIAWHDPIMTALVAERRAWHEAMRGVEQMDEGEDRDSALKVLRETAELLQSRGISAEHHLIADLDMKEAAAALQQTKQGQEGTTAE